VHHVAEETEVTMNAIQSTSSFILVIAIIGGLAACSPEPEKARYTVDEYLANPDAMDAKLKECANNPGDLGSDPDCVNVRAAVERQGIGSLRDLPPMGLATSEKEQRTDQSSASSDNAKRHN
jgi:hypothetical protein